MTLTLQLLTLFLATTGLAAPSTRSQTCKPTALKPSKQGYPNFALTSAYMALGTQDYVCKEGTYVSTSISFRLYDASCLNGTEYLDEAIAVTLDYSEQNPGISNSNLDVYIHDKYSLEFSGTAHSTSNITIEIQIQEPNSETIDVSVVQGTQNDHGETLTNEDVTVEIILNNPSPSPPSSSCAAGSGDIQVPVGYQMWVYTTSNND